LLGKRGSGLIEGFIATDGFFACPTTSNLVVGPQGDLDFALVEDAAKWGGNGSPEKISVT
jgi:hypothetical protein